ncbi:PAS domain-containing hybrid sensor histidine kinase/response regulator [Aquabacterium sp.]|uniref:hybrid sensor histidine kinase/response regulator n=1 Tax=Aquabacterium sp. TaxID=1872578 RepID=UPI0026122253|nr:PAS domain-containing hybrid sensor histidine kinase/response regulator [Aquabacterium sp.]MDD2977938.1 ATP-binding protein [Aquabacterium sp.]
MDAHGPPSAAASPSPSGAEAQSELDRLRTALALSQAREAELNAQLQRQEQLVQGLSRHVPGGLMMLDRLPNGHRRIPYASDGLFTLFDLDPALGQDPDALFQALIQRLHPDHRSMIQRWEVAAAAGAPVLSGDFQIVCANGEERWIAMQLGIQLNDDGHRIWYGMLQDVTVRQKMAQRLVERDVLLKSLGRNLPGVLFKVWVSPQGEPQLQYVSAQVKQLYELPDSTQPGDWQRHYERIHPDDVAGVRQLMTGQGLDTSKPISYEYRVQLPSKGLRWLAGQVMPMPEADGSVSWYGYTSDVTEQKLYADAVISAEAAERANRAKSEFLSRMSHELRTPLNAVIGFAQLLQMDRSTEFGETQRGHVRLIEKAGQHLLAVLGDVLDLSRIEAGSLPLNITAQDSAHVVDDALHLVSDLARRHRITLHTEGMVPQLTVRADRVRLRQVLVNLLVNAIKYNRPGGQVALSSWRDGGRIMLEVRDSGIGMDPTQLAHLFEPFNRLGAERTGIEGTGIGLVIVQRLVTLMQGQIEAHSVPGQGSCFRIWLPAASETPVDSGAMPLDDTPTTPPTDTPMTATILYAEDNEVNVLLVQEVIRMRPQWQLQVGRNGAQALALAQAQPPDLMLVDMHLGDMSGFDLADALDRDGRLRAVPRVALSADAMPDRIHAAEARGFKAYLTKPLDVMALLRCLDECLPSGLHAD